MLWLAGQKDQRVQRLSDWPMCMGMQNTTENKDTHAEKLQILMLQNKSKAKTKWLFVNPTAVWSKKPQRPLRFACGSLNRFPKLLVMSNTECLEKVNV